MRGGAPLANDVISFSYANVADNDVLTNDLNVALAGVSYTGSLNSSDPYKQIAITALHLADNATIMNTDTNAMSLGITIGTSTDYNDRVDVTGAGDLTMNGYIGYKNLALTGELTVQSNYFDYQPGDQMSKLIVSQDSSVNFTANSSEMTVNTPIELMVDRTQH